MSRPSDTREKLLDTATELVWQSNYGNVGVNEICEKAGVTKGSFYHHFESKAELFRAASEHSWQKIKAELDAIFSPETDSLTRLEAWIDLIISNQKPQHPGDNPVSGCPFFTSGAQCGNDEPVVRHVAIDMAGKAQLYYSAMISALQADGHLQDEMPADRLGRLLMHFLQGTLLYGRVMRDLDIVIEDLRTGIYRLIGLKPALRRKTTSALKETAIA